MAITNVGMLGERIIQVKRIVNYAKSIPAGERKTIKEIYDELKQYVTSEGQVGSTLQYYHKKGDLSRMREGLSHYWGKGAVSASALPSNASPAGLSPEPIGPTHELKPIAKAAEAEKEPSWLTPEVRTRIDKAIALVPAKTDRPEIRVEADRIIIEHAKCRIIVELL